MTGTSFGLLRDRLTEEAMTLFREMVDVHLAAGTGDKIFIRVDTMAGTGLMFSSRTLGHSWDGFDGGALDDLCDYGLLRPGYSTRGAANYRVTADGLAFHKWLMGQQGAPVDQVIDQVTRLAVGAEFATKHAGAAHHLSQAFELLWSGRTDTQTVSEIGDHLRKTLMDVTSDVVGPDARGDQEQPIARLKERLATSSLEERERVVVEQLIELARTALRLDHRLNHVRDEQDKERPAPDWEEVRRGAFATALVAYELSRVRFT